MTFVFAVGAAAQEVMIAAYCNVCRENVKEGDTFYHCEECPPPGFDLCAKCYNPFMHDKHSSSITKGTFPEYDPYNVCPGEDHCLVIHTEIFPQGTSGMYTPPRERILALHKLLLTDQHHRPMFDTYSGSLRSPKDVLLSYGNLDCALSG